MHIYDSRFPVAPTARLTPPDASVADYRKLQARLGLTRAVVVTPSTYGTDNRVTTEAIRALGPASRGVAVLSPDSTDTELKALDAAGIRGLRFNLTTGAFLTPDMIAPMAQRIADLGWHIQINMAPEQMLAHAGTLAQLPAPLVIDHIGRVPQPDGVSHPVFALIRRLLDGGRTWVKLSGPYISSTDGRPDFADVGHVARALVAAAPERLVWGSDWPHPTRDQNAKPDDAALLDLIADWAADPTLRARILVENPAELYRFN
ncbi:MAG: amidohydrolase family protein [Paracoccus sp. (in: a-proteobacteria)]|uniref:amidohydrolase family protein n=1 Tax=Paracoccus sp. TaxID=267 RepID=UPI0026DEDEE1|nr:amidohydrolase family protein [Paracoccus sp. (in: a-proteobacteria)]MDO5631609.1 amidohydrolase family protein [Paracoccus sp. (in: a-proteobacteria)]